MAKTNDNAQIEDSLFIDALLDGLDVQDDAHNVTADGTLKRITIDHDPSLMRRMKRRNLLDIREAAAAAQLDRLPADGEEALLILTGKWNGADLIGTLLRMDPTLRWKHIGLATMSMNQQNATQLAELIQAGVVQAATLVLATVFVNMNNAIYQGIHQTLTPLGVRIGATRNHAKLMTFEAADGRKFYAHGSINLRGCNALEQMALGQDAATHDFLLAFIREIALPIEPKENA